MRNKLFRAVLCCLVSLVLLAGTLPFSAEENRTVDEARNFIDGIVAYKTGGNISVQEWIDGELADKAGVSSEWYVIALSQSGDYDFSAYESALLEYLAENEVRSASSRLKYALALMAAGSSDRYIETALNESIGQQGVMSWVFGLHLMNNGCVCEGYSLSDVKEKLLSLQLEDGGWAVTGTSGDVDVTAMAIQALAPYYESDPAVKSSVDKAVDLLSERQKDAGDYASYGVCNPESTVQVVVALASLGIDCETDSRFVKNGNTAFDGVRNYRLSDGSFSHTQGGEVNETSTSQVFYGMVAYLRMMDGRGSLYLLDERKVGDTDTAGDSAESVTESGSAVVDDPGSAGGYKMWAVLAVVILAGGVCVVLVALKKRNGRNFVLILAVAAVAIGVILMTDFQTADQYYGNAGETEENYAGTVTVTIRCDTISGKSTAGHIPEDGVILDVTEVGIGDGDTVYDVLAEVTAEKKIHLETNGSADAVYVEGIGNIYEFDFGDLSGWIYRVNGVKPSVSCGEHGLTDGDRIEWLYSCKLGEDIE